MTRAIPTLVCATLVALATFFSSAQAHEQHVLEYEIDDNHYHHAPNLKDFAEKTAFMTYDVNRDGVLCHDELLHFYLGADFHEHDQMTKDLIHYVLHDLDSDKNGSLSWAEFRNGAHKLESSDHIESLMNVLLVDKPHYQHQLNHEHAQEQEHLHASTHDENPSHHYNAHPIDHSEHRSHHYNAHPTEHYKHNEHPSHHYNTHPTEHNEHPSHHYNTHPTEHYEHPSHHYNTHPTEHYEHPSHNLNNHHSSHYEHPSHHYDASHEDDHNVGHHYSDYDQEDEIYGHHDPEYMAHYYGHSADADYHYGYEDEEYDLRHFQEQEHREFGHSGDHLAGFGRHANMHHASAVPNKYRV